MDSLTKLLELSKSSLNNQKILDLFLKKSGNNIQDRADKAIRLMEQGKSFGRALADSLEK